MGTARNEVSAFRKPGDHPAGRAIPSAGAPDWSSSASRATFYGWCDLTRPAGRKPWKTDLPGRTASGTGCGVSEGERSRFSSAILPRWARRMKSLDALLPSLYLRGISAGDVQEVLTALLGKDAPNLSPAVLARLKGQWELSSSPVEEITQPGAKQSRPSRTEHFGG